MKRINNIFESICSLPNLREAFYKAKKRKALTSARCSFEVNLEWELARLHQELTSNVYQPGSYTTFKIFEPKERMISAASFRDRVVHHAICNLIEPIFEPTLIFDTYANRKGKGTHAGIKRCQQFLRKYPYVLKADIRKYFPSIDHAILKKIIRRKVKCQHTLLLIDRIIDNSNRQEVVPCYFEGDDLFSPIERAKGLPMGNLTSQFFANLYLSPFDHFVKEKLQIKGYVRYVDDFVLFHEEKRSLHEIKGKIEAFLFQQCRLLIHPYKSQISATKDGITFLGQRVFTTHRRLKRENVQRFRRRLEEMMQAYRAGELNVDQVESKLNSWLGHAKQADTFLLRKQIYHYLSHEKGLTLVEDDRFAWRLLEQQR
ncbi:MAG: reverse transcriptase/maturase family protein [Bacteroidota bacterium]